MPEVAESPVQRYFDELYKLRRSAWALAVLMEETQFGFSFLYEVDRTSLKKYNLHVYGEDRQIFFLEGIRKNGYITWSTSSLSKKALEAYEQWCCSFMKPKPHVIIQCFKEAAKKAGVEFMQPPFLIRKEPVVKT